MKIRQSYCRHVHATERYNTCTAGKAAVLPPNAHVVRFFLCRFRRMVRVAGKKPAGSAFFSLSEELFLIPCFGIGNAVLRGHCTVYACISRDSV